MGEKKGVTETYLEGYLVNRKERTMTSTQVASKTKISTEKKQDRIASEKDDRMRYEPRIRFSNPHLMRAEIVNGKVIVTAGWRDDDDD